MGGKRLDWMVIGAGPAGIAAVGKLLDAGISPKQIGWMDPHFQVGDLGAKWHGVSSNTQVDLFIRFLLECKSFSYEKRPKHFPIDKIDPKETCFLKHVVEPLQWITEHLKESVTTIQDTAMALNLVDHFWTIKTSSHCFFSKNVILAMGSEEKSLSYSGHEVIPLATALDFEKLKSAVQPQDTIGVFGASHSAVLILADLEKLKVKSVINFYRTPHSYAIDLGDWILFDNTGLKGAAAKWAKKNLDGTPPAHLKRVLSSDHTFEESLALCNKLIYSVGFERRKLPVLEQYERMHYNDKTGIIAPGLFGVGIAFPQAQYDPLMNLEYRVGLWKFMDYLTAILPIWIKYAN